MEEKTTKKQKGAYWTVHRDYEIDLSLSRNPLGCSKLIQDKVNLKTIDVSKYPHLTELMKAISSHFSIPEQNIAISSGIDGFISLFPIAFLKQGDFALIPETTFPRFAMAVEAVGGKPILIPLKEDMRVDFKAFKKEIANKNPKIIMLANPNNPTGLVEDKNKIIDLAEKTQALVIVDEAGIDFAEEQDSLIKQALELENLVVLRGFSKGYGLSGLRVGFCVASVKVLEESLPHRAIFPVTSIAIKAAALALSDQEHLKKTQELFRKEGKFFKENLERLGFEVLNPESNLIFAKVPSHFSSAAKLIEGLHEKNMHCVDGQHFGFPQFIRINPATRETNERFIKVIKQIIENKK